MSDEYDYELIDRISDERNWPAFFHPEAMQKFFDVAHEAYSQDTIPGYISAVLIQHQILEQLAINLIELSYLYLSAEIWPTRIHLKFDKKRALEFGKVLNQLEHSIDFSGKEQFLTHAREFNSGRISVVHKLLELGDIKKVRAVAVSSRKKFIELTQDYAECRDDLYRLLRDLNRRLDNWKDFI